MPCCPAAPLLRPGPVGLVNVMTAAREVIIATCVVLYLRGEASLGVEWRGVASEPLVTISQFSECIGDIVAESSFLVMTPVFVMQPPSVRVL